MKIRSVLLILLLGGASQLWANPISVLTQSKFNQLKNKPCALFIVWATWCPHCITEMPELIETLKKRSDIQLVLLDISSEYEQKYFSSKFIAQLTELPTFVAPQQVSKLETFVKSFEPAYPNLLPYKALYQNGVKVREWVGKSELRDVSNAFTKICKRL